MSARITLDQADGEDLTLGLPVRHATLGDHGIEITGLRTKTGAVTLDPGGRNTALWTSKICYIDGNTGDLRIMGYPIGMLVRGCSYHEVAYMLLRGKLPTQGELTEFEGLLAQHSRIDDTVARVLRHLPSSMPAMSKLQSVLPIFEDGETNVQDPEQRYQAAVCAIAQMPIVTAMIGRQILREQGTINDGAEFIEPDPARGYGPNFLHMLYGKRSFGDGVLAHMDRTVEQLCILHADHDSNLSTAIMRLTGSGLSLPFATLVAAVGALSGARHGGANYKAIRMLQALVEAGGGQAAVDAFIVKVIEELLKFDGFGHAEYRVKDPRAVLIEEAATQLTALLDQCKEHLAVAQLLERRLLSHPAREGKKPLHPNLDLYSGVVLQALGVPKGLFTPFFALGRVAGWLGQWNEHLKQDADKAQQLFRPNAVTECPPEPRKVQPIEERA